MDFKVDVRGMTSDKINKFTKKVVPKIVADSQRAAINKVLVKIRSVTVKSVARSARIKPQKIIRGRTGVYRANKRRMSGGVYFRYGPLPAEIAAGKSGPKWNKKAGGVKAGRYTFRNAFVATPRYGKHANKRPRVYERVSRTGHNVEDLHAQYIMLNRYKGRLKIAGNKVVRQLMEKRFVEQFEFRMQRAGYKV